jgi:hypothetical protein
MRVNNVINDPVMDRMFIENEYQMTTRSSMDRMFIGMILTLAINDPEGSNVDHCKPIVL